MIEKRPREIKWPIEFDDRSLLVNISGGKDSTALCLALKRCGINFTAIHADTGWEHPDTDNYIRDILDPIIGPIIWVQEITMPDLCREYRIFPFRMSRFCSRRLKIVPIRRYIEEHYSFPIETVTALGIRKEESVARSQLDFVERIPYGFLWRPILNWTLQDVIEEHRAANLKPNPLYLKGCTRIGCWPCIFARRKDLKLLAQIDPARIIEIEQLEHEIQNLYRERHPDKLAKPTFFQCRAGISPGEFSIRRAVEWARGSDGEAQGKLFEEIEDRSPCMRWGFCDT